MYQQQNKEIGKRTVKVECDKFVWCMMGTQRPRARSNKFSLAFPKKLLLNILINEDIHSITKKHSLVE